jgi:hypothetical protein
MDRSILGCFDLEKRCIPLFFSFTTCPVHFKDQPVDLVSSPFFFAIAF